ncbi:hypothetical protein BDW02DRAFT_245577 [Decorospora gaudefroyi]|uniref:RING-type domain-containing protein n=1 Tax=Decorospora gaudefroyi TaxID=184978 RepID=A0A6A5KDY5_9PLEO|nr:hypothetical protein BDW02DRAFT_245577 [Decorospora gaudefroyi]
MPSLRSQPEFYMTAVTPIDTTAEPLPGNTECTICLERLTTDVVRFRACGHMFHTVCVLSWFDESAPRSGRRRGTCPNCRQELYEPDPRSAGASTSNLQRIQEMQAEINRLIADRRGHESNYLQGPRPAQYPIWGPLQSSAQATRAGSTSAQSSDGGPLPNTDSSRYPHFIESGNRLAQNMFGDSPLSVPGRGRGMHPQIQSWPPRPAHGQEIDTEPEARSRRDNQATDASEPDLSEVPAPEQESRATLAARAIAERRPLTELETEWPAAASLPDEEEEEVFSLFEERSRALREGRPWQRGGMREQIGAQERLSNDRTPITTLPNERLLSEIGRLNARADQLRLQLLQNMEHDENRFSSPSLNPPPIPELQGSAVPFAQPARTDAELRAFFSSLPHPREQGLDRGRVPSQQHTPRRYATTANTTASPARNSHQDRTTTLRNHTPEWRTFHRDENTETGHTHTPTNGNPTRERQPHTRTDHYGFTTTQHRPHRPDPREPLGQLYMPHLAANMDELRELDDTPRPAYSPASATFSGGREMQLSESDEGDGLDEGFSDSG